MSRYLAFKASPSEGQKEQPRSPGTWQHSDEDDTLLAFQAETPVASPAIAAPREPSSRRPLGIAAAITALAAITGGIVFVLFAYRPSPAVLPPPSGPVVTTGTAKVDSNPGGMVTVDGVSRGMTPLTLVLPVGPHSLEITVGETKRSLPLIIEAGTTIKQDVEFATQAPSATGRLEVTSEPSGADVTIDGAPKGVTPLTLAALPIGVHKLTIARGDATIRRTVNVTAGATASIVASIVSSEAAAGWVSIKSPIELNVVENGEVIGTTSASRFMLPAGSHRLELTNSALEFRTTISVQIAAGRTVTPNVAIPNGSLSVNALPWAYVTIDGRSVGTTPLANLSLPLGSHEIVWQHPQLGERRRRVSVTALSPARAGVDFSQ
jgi:hypothetical protein